MFELFYHAHATTPPTKPILKKKKKKEEKAGFPVSWHSIRLMEGELMICENIFEHFQYSNFCSQNWVSELNQDEPRVKLVSCCFEPSQPQEDYIRAEMNHDKLWFRESFYVREKVVQELVADFCY